VGKAGGQVHRGLNLKYKTSITTDIRHTITLVKIIEKLPIRIPYTSHSKVLTMAITNITGDISLADFSFHVLTTWGINVMHDKIPAVVPMISIFI